MANYKIKQGDTLSSIAKANGTTIQEISKLNGISNPNVIYAGTTIQLPDRTSRNPTGDIQPTIEPTKKEETAATEVPKSYSDIDLSKYDSGYQKSEGVIAADNKKTEADNAVANYGDFAYSNDAAFKDVVDKILNREQFSYDVNGDALYQQYKDKYIKQGKMAMQDTMGQAAAMTGGYGNSYSASVGNQAYQASLENLNDIIPELYQMAYDKYKQEGQDLYNQYSMLSNDKNMEYGMWGDKRNALLADRDYYANEANNAYAKDYGEWADARDFDTNQYWNETNFGYTQDRDKVADEQWEAQFNEAKRQYDEQMAFSKEQYADSKKASVIESSGGKYTVDDKGNIVADPDAEPTDNTASVPQQYVDNLKSYKTNTAKADYLAGLVNDGLISEEAARELLAKNQNAQADLKDRQWTVIDKGGINWFGGVDNNVVVKDQYGNKMRLDDLVDALVAEGMTKKEAKAFAKKYS